MNLILRKINFLGDSDDKNERKFETNEIERSLTLQICGSKTDINKALTYLDNICHEKCPERTLKKQIIGHLEDDMVIKLQYLKF